jgi:hypothetical protein
MRNLSQSIICVLTLVAVGILGVARGDDEPKSSDDQSGEVAATPTTTASSSSSSSTSKPSAPTRRLPAHVGLLKDAKSHTGLFRLYQKGNKLYGELTGSNYRREYMVLIAIARGIGQAPLVGGFTWQLGDDDWIWKFRKIDDRVHVIRSNVRFRANSGFPEQTAVRQAYTDSVLFSLRILGKGPKGGDLVDLSPVFMSDLPQISQTLPGFSFSSTKSSWAEVKAFDRNVELEVAATYASSGRVSFDTVADSRGVTINVHYSISALPKSGYKTRVADDRIGYFLTVIKNFNKKSDRDQFERYINRWHLAKPPGATKAPYTPKDPIVFWIEKTVPHQYRRPVREGIEEWNKAFEKAGWLDAIEVRQQPDDADWDPEDINYNTFRWITSGAGFAMGPSRVNPRTGQILDADIIFDADFLQFWKEEFETLTPDAVEAMTGGPLDRPTDQASAAELIFGKRALKPNCQLSSGMARQICFGMAALGVHKDAKELAVEKEKLIMQALKETVMHEVGHTLGLRHNFKGSRLMELKDINSEEGASQAMVASVMDYNPTNYAPSDWHQGDYYTTTIGPYDYWAIEYGYTTAGSTKELSKIAARSAEPALSYATDEDTIAFDPDPHANRWDLGDDPLEYAKTRAQIVKEVMPGLIDRTTEDGDDYTQARRAFNILLSEHGQSMFFAARLIGGLHTSRSHKGDKDAKPPVEMVGVEKQRESLKLLEEQVFSDDPFDFPSELYNYLAGSNWRHWGQSRFAVRKDFPLHDVISMWQTRVLSQLLSSTTLGRMHDTEFKVPSDQDVLTTAELIERLTKSIFSELDTVEEGDFTNRKPAVSSLRRSLQREHLRMLARLAMGNTVAPDDCQTIAFAELSALEARIGQLLKSNVKLDSYSRAHMQETESRINKVLSAELSLFRP